MSIKIKEMREGIQRSLNDKKMMKFQENRLNNLQLKQKKIVKCNKIQEGDEVRKEKLKDEIEKAKKIAENVKTREKNFQEKKKLSEVERLLKMKQELEQKIVEEENRKLQFESKLTTLEEQEVGFLKRMKTTQQEDNSKISVKLDEKSEKLEFKHRSISTGASASSGKKAKPTTAK